MKADDILEHLNLMDEGTKLEAKGGTDIGKSCMETVCAFANTIGLGGGWILFGVKRTDDFEYEVTGVQDPDKLQNDLISQCRTYFNTPVVVFPRAEELDGKTVVVAEVQEAQKHSKPVYIASKGIPKGVFIRVGQGDQRVTDKELADLYRERDAEGYDESEVRGSKTDRDVSAQAVSLYRRVNSSLTTLIPDDRDLLYSLSCLRDDEPDSPLSVAGLLLFGQPAALRRYAPSARIDYIEVAARSWDPKADDRYVTTEIREPLLLAIPRLVSLILESIPKKLTLPKGELFREETPLLPSEVLREAVVNAVMHRCYMTKKPIQVIRYSNRIEIENPGYSLKPVEEFGRPGSQVRNEKIAEVLHETKYAETKGTGIRAMYDAMERANLTKPVLHSDREKNHFRVVLYLVNFLKPADLEWLKNLGAKPDTDEQAWVLVQTREQGEIRNQDVRSLCGYDTVEASRLLQTLRKVALLEQQGAGSATFYTLAAEPAQAWWSLTGEEPPVQLSLGSKEASLGSKEPSLGSKEPSLGSKEASLGSKEPSLGSKEASLGSKTSRFPSERDQARARELLGSRATEDKWRQALSILLREGELTRKQLSHLTQRKERQLRDLLGRLVAEGFLIQARPDVPNDPNQSYRLSRRA